MTRWKKMFGIFMAGAVLITGITLPQNHAATAAEGTDYGIRNPRVRDGVTTWDKIKFGSYYQDAVIQPAEPIKWRVLSIDENNNAFLLADKNLDAKPYNEELTDTTWETCTLRKWLNEDFYNEAFDAEERKAVIETEVTNDDNPAYGTEGGNDTKDKVYLLSIAEACNAAYGFGAALEQSGSTRESKNTDFAKVKNAESSSGSYTAGNGYWWLRSPGEDADSASFVDADGLAFDTGHVVHYSGSAVRPALRINLSSAKVTDAGEVDSNGNITSATDGIHAPRITDGVTTWDCVYFGSYRQNCNFEKKALEWRVLSVNGDDALLLADKNLDAKPYNESFTDVTWETCTLRKWLNGDFYNEAFDDTEKKAVQETVVVNEDNPYSGTGGGSDTRDKVYLLSIAEAGNAAYGFDAGFKEDSKTRESMNTDYAKVNNVRSGIGSGTAGNGYWWLRSPGSHASNAAYVNECGCGFSDATLVAAGMFAVRPALHIKLSSSVWSKAGEVSSEEQGEDIPTGKPDVTAAPTKEPGETAEPSQAPSGTAPPTSTQSPSPSEPPALRKLKVSGVACVKNTKKITGKVSVTKAAVRIKVGKRAYRKATVKGKRFTLKLNYRLKRKTKVTVKVTKKGYETLVRSFKVK